MKKIFYILAIFTMLFLSVYGQPPPPPHQHGKKPHKDKLGPDPMHFFRKAGITLTSAQTDRIYDIAIKFVNDEKSIRIKIEEIDYNIKNELIKDNPDRNILRDLIKRKKEIEAERDCLSIFRDLDIIEILTPEQRVQLNKYKK